MAKIKSYTVVALTVDGVVEERTVNARSLLTKAELKKRIKRQRRLAKVCKPQQPSGQHRKAIFAHTPVAN